ncbi:hypothetical protein PLEOSDRAFT_1077764 [Pleurotus ostreatus PC15]|uniref:Uncharacterized protein n=1 Tax=Pleurotus ostreatus (strain PC15) TaxID=1137138 RepID=A0A067NG17_PLEO1|nr:hypothetical protein PLEOSDRAFT_1077764 [Pleurotus ostreatus PC15]
MSCILEQDKTSPKLTPSNGGTQMPYITVLNCYASSSLAVVLDSLKAHTGLGAHKKSITAMINSSTLFLFEHHPRITPTALSLLHALQPFLDDDASTTQWFD